MMNHPGIPDGADELGNIYSLKNYVFPSILEATRKKEYRKMPVDGIKLLELVKTILEALSSIPENLFTAKTSERPVII
jgi:hypothetical protein